MYKTLIAILLTAVAIPSFAEYADVTSVRPIVRNVNHRVPVETCWDERVVHNGGKYSRGTQTIIGAVIGGALGNAVGHGKSNKKMGVVVGSILGGAVGRHHHDSTPSRSYTTYNERCSTGYENDRYEEVVGYRVTYEYNGRTYHTRTNRHPGDRIRVNVSVTPVR